MKKKLITMVAAMFAAVCAYAAIGISPITKTFNKNGGGAAILTSGSGTWTATVDVPWITVVKSSGSAGESCTYTVSANMTADTRVGIISIADNTYTVTQTGYSATLSPSAKTVDLNGGSFSVTITVDAGVSWTATANDDWYSVSPASGMSSSTVTITVNPYEGVTTRTGSLTIAGKTFTLSQTGTDVNISPSSVTKPCDVTLQQVTVRALSTTSWEAVPNATWITVVDPGNKKGDSTVTLAIAANPSFVERTGTVTIGSATLTVRQYGSDSPVLSILPTEAAAAATGAYGNIAVYATPDAGWTAEALDSWIKISDGETGSGNGNVKYVASANPTLEPRTGMVKITPPAVAPKVDLMSGLICWIPTENSIDGNSGRYVTTSFSTGFNGSYSSSLAGTSLDKQLSNDLAILFRFRVNDVRTVNRLFTVGNQSLYISADKELVFTGTQCTIRGTYDFKAATQYVVVINQGLDGIARIDVGPVGGEMTKIGSSECEKIIDVVTGKASVGNFKFGYAVHPTEGNLQGGYINNFMLWNRSLTEEEIATLTNLPTEVLEKEQPGRPQSAPYKFFSLNGNAMGTTSATNAPQSYNVTASGWNETSDRIGLPSRAMTSLGGGRIVFNDFGQLFAASCVTNNGNALNGYNGYNYWYTKVVNNSTRYYPYMVRSTANGNATYIFWLYLDKLPSDDSCLLFERIISSGVYKDAGGEEVSYTTNNKRLALGVTTEGCFQFFWNENAKPFSDVKIPVRRWVMVSLVGKDKTSVSVYLNENEVGNIASIQSFGWLPPVDQRVYNGYNISGSIVPTILRMTIGGWDGAIDEMAFYNAALSASQIKAIYEAKKPSSIFHTVTQGVVDPSLDKNAITVAQQGGTDDVRLTIAQNVNWSASTSADWITFLSSDMGTGPTTLRFEFAENESVTARTGTITIAGKTVTVTQEPLGVEVTYNGAVFDETGDNEDGGMGVVTIDTEGDADWTAESDVDWIYLVSSSTGHGSGSIWFVVNPMELTLESRTGTLTVAGKTVTVTQRGYELSIDPMIAEVGGNAGAGEFGVSAPIGAVWEAIATEPWIRLIGGTSGVGNGTLQYEVDDNLTGETRTGTIVVSGTKYTITQRSTLPLRTSVVGNGTVTGAGDYNQGVLVTLTATPATGYVFSHWSGDAVGLDSSVTITMDTAKNVTATFIPESAAEQLAAAKAAQGGFYTRDQIHALEVGNLVLDVDSSSGTARVGVQLMETSDLSDPNSWRPVGMTTGNLDVGSDGTVGLNVPATGNAKFFKVVVPDK